MALSVVVTCARPSGRYRASLASTSRALQTLKTQRLEHGGRMNGEKKMYDRNDATFLIANVKHDCEGIRWV